MLAKRSRFPDNRGARASIPRALGLGLGPARIRHQRRPVIAGRPVTATRPGTPTRGRAGRGTTALFFIVGPLRTGSSLLSRCIDDHPQAICLCESEINRALFAPYYLKLHAERMVGHGAGFDEIMRLLDRKEQNSLEHWLRWHVEAMRVFQRKYAKPKVLAFGDKSPDYFAAPPLVDLIANRTRAIYTTRNPRAILRSIWRQDVPEKEKEQRWRFLKDNIRAWTPHWDRANVLISRYEDLVTDPVPAMARVYEFLGLEPSTRFLEPFERLHPRRFLWDTAIDWKTGAFKDFDPRRAVIADEDLTEEQRDRVYCDPLIVGFMERFGYG
ncbi:hypothetical protein B2G71_06255 [Novosphingobium sp. PC22D]|uniref:sulfotransferase family protein n=1 Tax=Novosphingobium sp. PC22D TaxID=1962403 RepID=UPI000BF0F78E|nr:sulfotransferase [Novosphingobium sp. PC22D]PEQ13900.1 hypothetical protein B2G71_06255 [Novosphingobium sp. PC22D]